MLSFWERDALLDCDLAVIGAGIIGTLTAIEALERDPTLRVRVLERGVLPYGASSRNAGFACFGSLTELLADRARMGDEAALDVVAQRWRGLRRLRERLGDEAIGYEPFGGFEVLFEGSLGALDHMDEVNRWLRPVIGAEVFSVDDRGLAASGFDRGRARALVANPWEGQVHSGRLVRALHRLATSRGIEVLTGADVTALDEDPSGVTLRVRSPQGFVIDLRAGQVAVCTSGFTQGLVPGTTIKPARGQVIVTAPVPGLPWRGCHHFDEGYWYFRNVGERVLLGGGRNLDLAGEETSEMALTEKIQAALEDNLRGLIAPGRDVTVEHRWSGIMGFSADKRPVVRRVGPRVVVGFGCNGMGVALGAEIASSAAKLLG